MKKYVKPAIEFVKLRSEEMYATGSMCISTAWDGEKQALESLGVCVTTTTLW